MGQLLCFIKGLFFYLISNIKIEFLIKAKRLFFLLMLLSVLLRTAD